MQEHLMRLPGDVLVFSFIALSLGFFFSSRRRHTRSLCDWSSDVCSSDLLSPTPTSSSREPVNFGEGARDDDVGVGERIVEKGFVTGARVGEMMVSLVDQDRKSVV